MIPKIKDLFSLENTIAASLFDGAEYPWEVLDKISDYIIELGKTLDPELYENRGNNVYVARDAKVFDSAYIAGPCIIDSGAEVRHCAFIRGNAIVGEGAVVGNSTELKNVILFNKVQVPHYNYVGDSVLGNHAHMGAGAVCSNLKADGKGVVVRGDENIDTGLRKFGGMLADNADIGCGCILNPGTVVGKNTSVYPLTALRGVYPANSIVKSQDKVVLRKENA